MDKKLNDAYGRVIKDLEKNGGCKEKNFTFFCGECQTELLHKLLKSYFEMLIESEKWE